MAAPRQVPIAIVGMGAIMPGASDVAGFWRCLVEGRDLITDVPESRWLVDDHYDPDPAATDRTYSRRGAFLPEVDFDPAAYGIPPNTLSATDSSQLLALLVAEATMADAGVVDDVDRERVSVIIGAAQLDLPQHMAHRLEHPVWRKALRELGLPESQITAACEAIADHYVPWQEATFPGLLGNVIAGRIANRFDFHGTNFAVDAACASSLAALSIGMDELALGRADLVLAGGVDTMSEPFMYMCFSKTPAMSTTGDCRPFSAAADGTVLGEGLVMFALARLADAEAAGMRVHAVVRGLGSSSDGRGGAIYAPAPPGQARALRRAYEAAGYGPHTVQLVEAHGTGTAAGDLAEFAALRDVFDATGRQDRQWCALGSVKSQIGHTKCAAGAAGLLKAVLALQHQALPPTLKVDEPDPRLEVTASPFYVNTATRPWIAAPGHPRRAAVSSFGFGGTNFHVTLEEYLGERPARRLRAVPSELVLASGRTLGELRARLDGDDLVALARRSRAELDPADEVRLAIVATSTAELRSKLDRAIALGEQSVSTPDGISLAIGPATAGKVGLIFPGQGSQYVGMGADLALHVPGAKVTWAAAAAVDPSLAAVVFPPPAFTDSDRAAQERRLTAAEWAPPALAVTSLVLLDILRAVGIRPDAVAGHSLGELVALHAAGVFDGPTLIGLARRRGELTRDAAGEVEGAMLAVLAAPSQVDLTGVGDVWVANENGPAEVVLSGTVDGIALAERVFTERGLTVRHLNTATAFHSPIVAAAVTPLRDHLAGLTLGPPQLPVFGNADAALYPADPEAIRDRLASQLAAPVRFAETIEAMHAAGIRTFVEVGAGAVLTGMVDRILAGTGHHAIALDRRGANGLTRLQQALGQLAVLGVPLDLAPLEDEPAPEPAMSSKPRMVTKISGGNYGRPYPPPGGTAGLPAANPEAVEEVAPPQPAQPALARPPAEPERGWATLPTPGRHREVEAVGWAQPGPTQDDGEWFRAIEESQRHVAEAHRDYQQALTDGHVAFLRMADSSFAALAAHSGRGGGRAPLPGFDPTADPVPVTEPVPVPSANGRVVHAPAGVQRQEPAPNGIVAPPADPTHPLEAPEPGSVEVLPTRDEMVALVLSVVAEKTGYPLAVLGADMDLETDLGVDSIKRVEILAAVREHLPSLARTAGAGSGQAAVLARLRTVKAIADQLVGADPAGAELPPAVDLSRAAVRLETGLTPDSGRAGDASGARVTRRAVRTTAAAPSGSALAGFASGPVTITDDGGGVADALAARLRDRGTAATVVSEMPEGARQVILLEGLGDVNSLDHAVALQRKAFRSARRIAAAMERDGGLFVVVQDTGGHFGLRGSDPDRAWVGGLAALARTAAREWPGAAVKAIDCERGGRDATALADAILAELDTGGPTLDVGLGKTGARVTLEDVESPATPGELPFPDGGVLVVTGGARGITAAAVRAVGAWRTKLVLLGRTTLEPESGEVAGAADEAALLRLLARPGSLPAQAKAEADAVLAAREVRRTLADLAELGAEARYLPIDVTDRAALGAALDGVRQDWGPITGIVHGAGVLADRRIADKTDAQFDAVFDTKVDGLRALLEATVTDPLRLIIGFGSVVARFGNVGQCDYAMANETVSHVLVSEAARRPGCLVRCLLWGPWAGGMVTESMASHFREGGVALIPLSAGADAFCAELATGPATEPGPVSVLLVANRES